MTKTLVLITLIFVVSCEDIGGYKYDRGSLPTSPVNLTEFNTEYDDYNSTAPSLGDLIPFCFSTNRNSFGDRFDIIYLPMNVNFNKSSGELTVKSEYGNWSSRSDDYEIIKLGINKIRTSGNEFGPNLIVENSFNQAHYTLMYSSDVTGNSQINFITNLTNEEFSDPKEVEFLNSEFEDMYPTFNSEKSELYFCSNRNGENFDFFRLDVDPLLDTESLLSSSSSDVIEKDVILSSNSNDKCPFIFGNKMVFASDRDGGFGGYDLYSSTLLNGEWSEPINMGETINSESDEFRPILVEEGVSDQIMMVFSSDRVGGMGGFDLYFVGIDGE